MSRRPHKHDVSIGENAWISFGDLANGQSRAVEIDPYLAPVLPFVESLETTCVAECCGINAFLLWPEEIEKATAKSSRQKLDDLVTKFASVNRVIEALPSDTVVSTRLNQYFRKGVLLKVLAHIRSVVEGLR